MSKLCLLSLFHQTLGFKEQWIHHEKYCRQPLSVSQNSCSIQPVSTFTAVDWILKQDHSFTGICLLFSAMGCHIVVTGISERKERCLKLKDNLEKFRAHTMSVAYLEITALASDA